MKVVSSSSSFNLRYLISEHRAEPRFENDSKTIQDTVLHARGHNFRKSLLVGLIDSIKSVQPDNKVSSNPTHQPFNMNQSK